MVKRDATPLNQYVQSLSPVSMLEIVDILRALELAHDGPLVLIAPNGREYVLVEADDFGHEVETLRTSIAFQQFLDA